MVEMIHERQHAEKVQRHDLLSNLLEANDHAFDVTTLTEDEIIGNIYIFSLPVMRRPHIFYALRLLCLHYIQRSTSNSLSISSLSSLMVKTNIRQMPVLTYSMAVFNETLRLFPPATSIHRCPIEDTSLVASNIRSEKCTVPIAKDIDVVVSIAGLHHNRSLLERSPCLQTFPLP